MILPKIKVLKSHGWQYIPDLNDVTLTEEFRGRPVLTATDDMSEGSGLTGTTEAQTTGGSPGQGVTVQVGDGDHGVVEGRANMHSALLAGFGPLYVLWRVRIACTEEYPFYKRL